MNRPVSWSQLRGGLARLPAGLRLMIGTFVVIIGCGYLSAVANVYYSHRLADGTEGLGLGDIRAVYGGLRAGDAKAGGAATSRMLTMVRGAMRQYFDSDEDYAILEKWLVAGADPAGLDAGEGRQTPRRVLIRSCLRCHAVSTGSEIARKAPFGQDEFDADAAMLARFTGAGGANAAATGDAIGDPTDKRDHLAPPQYDVPRLLLISHQHMLAIPIFTILIGGLFALTRWPAWFRAVLVPLPMLATLLDFSGWYLARVWSGGAWLIAVMGGVFGLALGVQILAILIDLARPASREPSV